MKQISVLIWVPVVFIALSLPITLYRTANQFSDSESVIAIAIVGLAIIGITATVTWNFFNWINALIGHKTRTSFPKSSNRLIIFMNIALVLAGLAILGNIFGFVASLTRATGSGTSLGAQNYIQFLNFVVTFLTAYAVRTWLRLGYSYGPIRQRSVLIWALWLNVLVSILGWVEAFSVYISNPANRAIGPLLTSLVGGAIFIWICVLVLRLVRHTFGVSEMTPSDRVPLH